MEDLVSDSEGQPRNNNKIIKNHLNIVREKISLVIQLMPVHV